MKIIHTSDLHLDSALTTRLDSNKVRERKSELILSFKRITENARRDSVKAIIIAGDLFDTEKVGKRTQKNVIDIIRSCPETAFLYLSGNHERAALLSSGIELPENLKIFGEDWTYYRLGDVNFIGRSETSADMFDTLRIDKSEKNIVVLHGELRDRSAAGGVIGTKDVEDSGIDYLALGHYHSYLAVKIGNRCTAVYPGTPEGRGFDEAGDCGYVTVNTDAGLSHVFTKSAKRALRIIEADVTDTASDMALIYKIEDSLKKIPSSDLVRIVLTGERALGRSLDTEALLSSLSNSFYYVEIRDETRLRISADDFKNDISLKGEFIRGVLSDDSLDEREKEAIINLGLGVLMEEE